MVKLFGQEWLREELLTRVGDISQLGGVRLCTLADGMEKGVQAVEFRTGSGLDFTVLPDRGMGIGNAAYNGQALAWRSQTGDTHPAYYEEPGAGWHRGFGGGLVVTCGLTNAGAPSVDQGKALGLHGRVSNIAASNLYCDAEWRDDSYVMWAQGKVREAEFFGENVEMVRTITAKLGEPKIWIHDKITNRGHTDVEHMLIYHCNIGFPVLNNGSRLIAPVKECKARDVRSEHGVPTHTAFTAPVKGIAEEVFYLDLFEDKSGVVDVAVVNEAMNDGKGFGIYVRYPKKELPRFIEWKMMGQGEYVVGIEPANCGVEGRAKERERGTLQMLKPGETREYHLELGVLTSNEEISNFEKIVQSVNAG